ncbi:MAG: cell division protein FtsW [Sedimentisphaerales bacterium]|nr:cell division protein FtsW [Sedimentisphaerales bacterium]
MLTNAKYNQVANFTAGVVVLLMAVGAVFVFSAGADLGSDLSLHKFYNYAGLRQILFFPLACVMLFSAAAFDYRKLRLSESWLKSPALYLLILSIALLILVLIPRFGTEINYARRWLRIPIGPFKVSFQPSELAKWSLIFFIAVFCDKYADSLKSFWRRFVPICCVVGLVVGLIVIEDVGTAAFVSLLAFLMLIIAGAKWWHVLTPLPFGVLGFLYVLIRSPARLERIWAWIWPEKYGGTVGYQANQSLIALGSGGILGKGLGEGICKYGHLPEDTTDFIFAIIGEELGFVGNAAVILLFIIFMCLGIVIIVRCKDRFGQFLAGGIVLAIGIQAAINIGVVTVVLPTKGIPLPFVSAGGTSLLLSSAAVGVLLNIARQTAVKPAESKIQNQPAQATINSESRRILIHA